MDYFFLGCPEYQIDRQTSNSSCSEISRECLIQEDNIAIEHSDSFFDGCEEHRICGSKTIETDYLLQRSLINTLHPSTETPWTQESIYEEYTGYDKYMECTDIQSSVKLSSNTSKSSRSKRHNYTDQSVMTYFSGNKDKPENSYSQSQEHLFFFGCTEYEIDQPKSISKLLLNNENDMVVLPSEYLVEPKVCESSIQDSILKKSTDRFSNCELNNRSEISDDCSNSDIEVAKGVQMLNECFDDFKERKHILEEYSIGNKTTLPENNNFRGNHDCDVRNVWRRN